MLVKLKIKENNESLVIFPTILGEQVHNCGFKYFNDTWLVLGNENMEQNDNAFYTP